MQGSSCLHRLQVGNLIVGSQGTDGLEVIQARIKPIGVIPKVVLLFQQSFKIGHFIFFFHGSLFIKSRYPQNCSSVHRAPG